MRWARWALLHVGDVAEIAAGGLAGGFRCEAAALVIGGEGLDVGVDFLGETGVVVGRGEVGADAG